ncbi:MAG: DnaJ domain-containing protein, partial [Devosia sp.]
MEDPYVTLGLTRDVGPDEIRAAYRKLVKLHHPDLNPGNAAAEERFKIVSAANELLSDPDKRTRFDRGEID